MDTEIIITAKEKYNPRSKQEAYCFQLFDDIRMLRTLSILKDKDAYNKHVDTIIQRLEESKIKN